MGLYWCIMIYNWCLGLLFFSLLSFYYFCMVLLDYVLRLKGFGKRKLSWYLNSNSEQITLIIMKFVQGIIWRSWTRII